MFRFPKGSAPVFLLLVCIDFALIGAFLLSLVVALPDRFELGWDRGYPEMFNFLKWSLIIALSSISFLRWRNPLFLGLAASALVLLLDDSRQIHERFAVVLLDASSLRALDLPGDHMMTEVVVFGMLALLCVALIALSLRLGRTDAPRPASEILRAVVVIIVAIAAFGIGVDGVHGILDKTVPGLSLPFLLLEEAGEMIGISYLAAYFAWLAGRDEEGLAAGRPAPVRSARLP